MAKILIVEDDPLIARVYSKTFIFKGHEVAMAYDGEDGLSKAKYMKPDLILLDVMMPKMNGFEVLSGIKADPEIKDIPVVMLTNLSGEKDKELALTQGAKKYIIKSDYEPEQIANMVDELL